MRKFLSTKWLYYLGGAIILIIILYEANGIQDFDIYFSASRDLLLGKNIYQIQYHEWYHYYYDVLFALILAPFTLLPMYVVKVTWLILNIFFVYRIWRILMGWLPVSLLNKRSEMLFVVLSFIFILRFLRDNFHLGQVTIFLLYLILEGLYLISTRKSIAGSILIALGINVKILPIVIIPYLLYRKEWKSALFVIGFMIVFLLVPIVFIGYDYNEFLLIERWHLINPMNQSHILDTSERSFHSLTTVLATLLVKDCGDYHALALKRNIADISIQNLNVVITVVRGVLILFTLYFLKTRPFVNTTSKLQKLYEISYLCLIVPLIFPHQQHYAFFLIFPASTYLLFYFVYMYYNNERHQSTRYFREKKVAIIVFLSIAYFLTSSHFILGEYNNFYDHYKTLTYGVLILMILLAVCKPDKLLADKPGL